MAYNNIYDTAHTTRFATGLGDELGRAIAYGNTLQTEEQRLRSMSDEILEHEQAVQRREEEEKSKERQLRFLGDLMSEDKAMELAQRFGRPPTWEEIRRAYHVGNLNNDVYSKEPFAYDAPGQPPLQRQTSPTYSLPSPVYDPDSYKIGNTIVASPPGSPRYHAPEDMCLPASPVAYPKYSSYDESANSPVYRPNSPVYRPSSPLYRSTSPGCTLYSPVYRRSSPFYEKDIKTEVTSQTLAAYYRPTSPSYETDIISTANPPETQVYHNTEYFKTILSPTSPAERDYNSYDHSFDEIPLPGDKYMPLPAVKTSRPPSKSFWDVV